METVYKVISGVFGDLKRPHHTIVTLWWNFSWSVHAQGRFELDYVLGLMLDQVSYQSLINVLLLGQCPSTKINLIKNSMVHWLVLWIGYKWSGNVYPEWLLWHSTDVLHIFYTNIINITDVFRIKMVEDGGWSCWGNPISKISSYHISSPITPLDGSLSYYCQLSLQHSCHEELFIQPPKIQCVLS